MKKILSVIFTSFVIFLFLSLNASAQMFWNQAASFSGTPVSYISVPNSSSIDLTGSFTIEAWISPSSLSGASKGIISKGGLLGTLLEYAIRLNSSGRISIITDGTQRLISRNSNPVLINKWTHFSASFNSSTSLFSIYINGVLDTSTTTGAAPPANSDSLFIGISGSSTPFSGQLDDIRLWNRELSSAEVGQYFRTSLGTSSGIYNGLVLSIPFQKESSSGTKFTTRDFSGNKNDGIGRNVITADQSYRPLKTISINESVELDGTEDYLAAKDTSTLNPTDFISLDCWVYPKVVSQTCNLISKGSQYGLKLENGILKGSVNGNTINSNLSIDVNKWTKITFQYTIGLSAFFLNGEHESNLNTNFGNVSSGTDSLYIGGAPGATGDFNGYIDEARIMNHFFFHDSVFTHTFHSIDKSNDPSSLTDICYNLDGYLRDNAENGGPELFFRNNARFSHPACIINQPVSPLNRDFANSLSDGFYIFNNPNVRIPSSGTTGTTTMTINAHMNKTISDIDVFIALKHTALSNLTIYLRAPNNDSVRLMANMSTSSLDNNLVTIFDDQADSSIGSNKFVSFYTSIKPENNINSVFGGDNSKGNWILSVTDGVSNDTGLVYTWGIRFNNMNIREKNLTLSNYIQGFYNEAASSQVSDTISVYLRDDDTFHSILDSAKGVMGTNGVTRLSFAIIPNAKSFYIQLNHRNSIETWSSITRQFLYSSVSYNFDISNISAFGNNQIQVDASPLRFGIYGGDVNQDGLVNLNDILQTFNDATAFATGYIQTDITGDNIANLTDILLAFNNSNNFVHKITP